MKTTLFVSLTGALLLGLGLNWAQAEDSDAFSRVAARRVAIGTCAACHGPQGHSFSPKFPVLADQQASYLISQLQAFKAQTRGDPDALGYMWGMAAPLDDVLITGLADYYSHQSALPGRRAIPNSSHAEKPSTRMATAPKAFHPAPPAMDRRRPARTCTHAWRGSTCNIS